MSLTEVSDKQRKIPDLPRRRSLCKKLLFLSLVLALSVLPAEGLIRLCYPLVSNYNMEMWRYASDMKMPLREGSLPFRHYPNRTGEYYGTNITTNSMGFRDREFALLKPEGKTRILFVGDSVTLGWGVEHDETMPKLVEKQLNTGGDHFEVINMGIGNYNSVMEVELFKQKGLQLKPDAVVLIYFINDAEPIPLKPRWYTIRKRSYLLAFLSGVGINARARLSETFSWKTYYSHLYRDGSETLAASRSALHEMSRLCAENGIQLVLVSFPELHSLKDYPFRFVIDYVESVAAEGQRPFLDLLPEFVDHEPQSLWVSLEDAHPNSKASSIAADAIEGKIREVLR